MHSFLQNQLVGMSMRPRGHQCLRVLRQHRHRAHFEEDVLLTAFKKGEVHEQGSQFGNGLTRFSSLTRPSKVWNAQRHRESCGTSLRPSSYQCACMGVDAAKGVINHACLMH